MTATLFETVAEPILVYGLTWREFKATEQLIDRPGIRLSFLDGILEIRKMPGEKHETLKERIGALLEIYLEFLGLDFTPTGSVTLESESERVKREADKSYKLSPGRKKPELAIEVVVTSGGIDKLEAYQRLKIAEVWFWEGEQLSVYALGETGYQLVSQSQLLPSLDITLFMRCVNLAHHTQALREFRQGLQG